MPAPISTRSDAGPVARAETVAFEPCPALRRLKEARILVVDDSLDIRTRLRRLLSAEGATTVDAGTAREALQQALTAAPDAILLDLDLPDASGLDVCRHLRSLKATRNIPVCVLTGCDPDIHHAPALEMGADDFVTKPVDPRILVARLGNLVGRYRAEQANNRLRRELERYVSEAAVHHARAPQAIEHLDACILFSDLRNFTATCFDHELEDVFSALNTVMARQTEIIRHWGGYVDRFAGDGIMAVFADASATWQACRAAEELIRWARRCDDVSLWHPLPVAVGIHAGQVMRGDVGSERRREYTVMGPTVNVASRLCSHARALEAVVSAEVVRRAPEALRFGPPRQAELKGLPAPIEVRTLHVDD